MTARFLRALLALLLASGALLAHGEDLTPEQRRDEFKKMPWQKGPAQGKVGDKAQLALPADSGMLAQGKTDRFFELTGNLPDPAATVVVRDNWFAVFWFNDSGYIKDDEKLDPDKLLASLKDRDGRENEERARRGLPKMYTDSWIVPPHYDAQTKRLEWGVRIRGDNGGDRPVVNYTVRVLGRSGYESIVLVSSPETLERDVQSLKTMLEGFDFNSGEKYAEFREGDKVAAYGLGALIVGGAAAAAVKTGFWKVIVGALAAGWKVVLAGFAALVAGVSKLLGRKKAQ